jgi:membrane-bound lytic murein transglycosylase B
LYIRWALRAPHFTIGLTKEKTNLSRCNMRVTIGVLGIVLAILPACGGANVERSIRPTARLPAIERAASVTRTPEFSAWISGFRLRALSEGVSAATFDRAFRTVSYELDVIRRDANQAEFVRPIWQYLDSAVSDARISNGQRMLREYASLLDQIEARYGVEKEVVVAIWGLESSYGDLRGTTPILSALATLAHEGRRGAFFESQLVAALRIVQSGDVSAEGMVGSWAGAMGHTQFIPTSYLDYAVDFRGDGQRDIWSEDPTDALASTAAYLSRFGWTTHQPWGVEVRIPRGFDASLAGSRRSVSAWEGLGLRAAQGSRLPSSGDATLMFPAGSRGPALLAFGNFRTIKHYNNSDAYVIAIGHLADRLRGGNPFHAEWPRTDRPLDLGEREEMQRLLVTLGYDTGGIDGRVGPATIAAVRLYQAAAGLSPDGYISLELLQQLRRR